MASQRRSKEKGNRDDYPDDPSYHLPGSYLRPTRNVDEDQPYLPAAFLYDGLKWNEKDLKLKDILEDDFYTSAISLIKLVFSKEKALPEVNHVVTLSSLASNSMFQPFNRDTKNSERADY